MNSTILKLMIAVLMLTVFVFPFSGCSNNETSPDPSIVAKYEGGQITREQLKDRIKSLKQNLGEEVVNEVIDKTFYKQVIQTMVIDQMIKTKIAEKKLGKSDDVKHAMKHISEELNINELHSRAHDNQIKVSENDIKTYYEENRQEFEEKPLNEVKEYIRGILQDKEEVEYFKNYINNLKKNAVVTRENRLLNVPDPTETELQIYFERNRKKYGAPEKSFNQVKERILADLKKEKEAEWFEGKKNRTLFTIHGKRHTVGEFYEEFKELPFYEQEKYQNYDSKIKLLDKLIERLLIVEDTYDQMLDNETKDQASHAKEDILKQLLHQEEVDDKLEIKDEEVKAYFEKHKSKLRTPPQVKISYIRVGAGQSPDEEKRAKEKINRAYKKLKPGFFKDGAKFETVAAEFSEDPETAKKGGKTSRWITEGENIIEEISSHEFHENVLNLEIDEISRPFLFNNSWYIARVRERKEPKVIKFEDVKEHIKEALLQQKHEQLTISMEEELMARANLTIYNDVIKSMLKTDQ